MRAAIVHGDVAINAHGAGYLIDLDAAEIENKTVTQRAVDLIGVGRRGEFRRRPEHRLADRLTELGGDRARRPMPGRREARERQRIIGIGPRGDAAAGKYDFGRRHVELRRRHARQAVAQIQCRHPRGAGDRRSKPAGIIARGDGPGVLGGVDFGDHPDILRL